MGGRGGRSKLLHSSHHSYLGKEGICSPWEGGKRWKGARHTESRRPTKTDRQRHRERERAGIRERNREGESEWRGGMRSMESISHRNNSD